ncbi:hypothetical protein APUTEX25_004300, partial [Auxenochlorella protothecoides]
VPYGAGNSAGDGDGPGLGEGLAFGEGLGPGGVGLVSGVVLGLAASRHWTPTMTPAPANSFASKAPEPACPLPTPFTEEPSSELIAWTVDAALAPIPEADPDATPEADVKDLRGNKEETLDHGMFLGRGVGALERILSG